MTFVPGSARCSSALCLSFFLSKTIILYAVHWIHVYAAARRCACLCKNDPQYICAVFVSFCCHVGGLVCILFGYVELAVVVFFRYNV